MMAAHKGRSCVASHPTYDDAGYIVISKEFLAACVSPRKDDTKEAA